MRGRHRPGIDAPSNDSRDTAEARLITRTTGLASFIAFAGFLAGSSPLVFWRDSAEFAMLGHNLDIGHPAGSPAFSIAEKWFDLLPLGAISYRPVILTMLFGALSAALLARLVAEIGRDAGQPAAGAAGGLLAAFSFAFAPALFEWTVAPEVYTGQLAAMFGVLFLAWRARAGGAGIDRRIFYLAGLVLGLGCGMHMATVLLAPGLAFLLFASHPRPRLARDFALFGLFFTVGFSVYALLPIRSVTEPPFDYGNVETGPAFFAHITGRAYSDVLASFPWPRAAFNLRALAGHIPGELSWPAAVLTAVGTLAILRAAPVAFAAIALMIAGHFYLYIRDWSASFGYLPVLGLFAFGAGSGVVAIARRVNSNAPLQRWVNIALFAVAALVLATQSARALTRHSHARHDTMHRHARTLLDSLPPFAIYVSHLDANSYPVFFMQSVERFREDVAHVQRAWLPFPDELRRRAPSIDWSGYRPDEPFSAHRTLLAQPGRAAFWDYGWEDMGLIDATGLAPHGFLYRVVEPGSFWPLEDDPVYRERFVPIQRRGNRFEFDFTFRDIYATRHALRAKMAFDRGDYATSERDMRRAVKIDPESGQHRARLAIAQSARRNAREAYTNALAATELEPWRAENWNIRAAMEQGIGLEKESANSYARSLEINRYQFQPAVQLAALHLAAGRFGDALAKSRDALAASRSDDERALAEQTRVRALIGLGRCGEALPAIDALLFADPNDAKLEGLRRYCESRGTVPPELEPRP
ncbi:DUF2723 domain-containing protein [bacterium]|nr:DUF2723 domain-containing protein [bacterium]